MYPELDLTDPTHKAVFIQAKKAHKSRAARAQLLGSAKEEEDADNEKLVAKMHEAKLTKFQHQGITVELISREKAKVELVVEDDEDDE